MSWNSYQGRDPFDNLNRLMREVAGLPTDQEIVPYDDRQLPMSSTEADEQWEAQSEDEGFDDEEDSFDSDRL